MDPFTLSLIASGVQAGIGAFQSAGAAKKRNDALSKLEQLAANSPLQKESKTLNDYYQESLNRYKENPFTTPYYLETLKQSDRAATQALGALQTRGAAIGGASRINRILQDAKNRGIAGAMQNKNAQFSQLGSATQMKKAEENALFDINKMTPYNRKLQLQQMAAEGYASDKSAYDQSVQSGLNNAATALMYKGMYKTPKPPIDFSGQINASKAQFEIDRANLPKINPNYRSNYRGMYKDYYFPMTDYSNLV